MDYKKFKEKLKELVDNELGGEITAHFLMAERNNGETEESITFSRQEISLHFLISLQSLYEIYLQT